MQATFGRVGWPPHPTGGGNARYPSGLNRGRAWDRRRVTRDRTVAGSTIVRTRQVTVTTIICGVDVSKARLDVHVAPGDVAASFANDAEGLAALAGFCRDHAVELVAMEATGGHERLALLLLTVQGITCARVDPRQVRRFAQAMGQLEKTDRLDAAAIAAFAAARRPAPTVLPSPAQRRLDALAARLRQITSDLTLQTQRRHTATDPLATQSIDTVIALLRKEARRFEDQIAALIDDDPLWSRLAETFRSIKGIAGRTVAYLLAELPEIGTCSNKAIAKLVGLAPLADDSGPRTGRRHIRGGRAGVRSILFLVARIAARFDTDLATFHQRLIRAGKPKMVARIALARKLLVRLNAKARETRAKHAIAT